MAEHHTPTPWKWHPKDEPNERNGSVYSEQKPGHAYAVAMQPKYVGNVQWSEDAALIVRAVNSHNALVKALKDAREALYWHSGGGFEPDGSDGKTIDQIIDATLSAVREQHEKMGRDQ